MKPVVFTTALTLVTAAPAFAQSMQNMPNMPGMQHPQTHQAPAPANRASARHRRHRAHPAQAPATTQAPSAHDMSTMPGMTPQGGATSSGEAMQAMPGMTMEETVGNEPPPPAPTDRAADRFFDPALMAAARNQVEREHGGSIISKVMLNLAEAQFHDGETSYRWDGEAWIGGDINRFVIKSEGEAARADVDSAEVQALYSRAITPYFDVQIGVRQDFEPQPRRTYAVLGAEGVAPYWFEVNGALFVSNHGEVLGRLEGTYDLRLTQRLILQPRAETNLSADTIPEIGIGSGVSNVELGLRLRYDISRQFSPYVGVSFDRKLGDTADFARARGEDPSQTSVVLGIRTWF